MKFDLDEIDELARTREPVWKSNDQMKRIASTALASAVEAIRFI